MDSEHLNSLQELSDLTGRIKIAKFFYQRRPEITTVDGFSLEENFARLAKLFEELENQLPTRGVSSPLIEG